MSYRYAAASGYTAPQTASSTSSHYRPARSAPGPSVASYMEDNTARSTRERWQAAQAPAIHTPADTRTKTVRFARPGESPSPAYLHPGGSSYTPASPSSAYMSSPRAPSLTHSTDGEYDDDLECPPTPEHRSIPLPSVNAKTTKSRSHSKTSTAIPPTHRASYATIDQIMYEMNSLVSSFRCPSNLEFEPAPLDPYSVPRLTFSSKNRSLLEQNQRLEKLQSRLDAVESHGDANVRRARKDAVGQVENALEDVKRMQAAVWNKHVYEQRKKRHT